MRAFALLTILIMLGGAGYIGFSVISFEPEELPRYNLSSTSNDSDILDSNEQGALNVQAQHKRDLIVNTMTDGILKYDQGWIELPAQATTISSTIVASIKRGLLPIYYPVSNFQGMAIKAQQNYLTIELMSQDIAQVPDGAEEGALSTAQCASEKDGFILGDTGANILDCDKRTYARTRFYLSGPGNDQVNVRGNAIIDAGTGNDKITAGPEFTMIYVAPNFGSDIIKMDCSQSHLNLMDQTTLDIVPWSHEYVHFVVFDSRISKEDVIISDNVIKHKITGDRMTFNKNCFNVVFASDS